MRVHMNIRDYMTEFRDDLLSEVEQRNDEGEAMDGVFDTLSSTSSLLMASPVPSQSTFMMRMVLVALMFTEFMQAFMTYITPAGMARSVAFLKRVVALTYIYI